MNSLAGLLSERLSKEQVVDGFDTEAWAVCGRVPQAVVFPESEEQVAEILSLSSEEGWRCVPGGRGSWLNGGQPPQSVDVLLSAERMNDISAYEPADLFIEAQAGAGLDALERRTAECQQWLALDPPGGERGTLGAMLAVGTAGPLQAEFGCPRFAMPTTPRTKGAPPNSSGMRILAIPSPSLFGSRSREFGSPPWIMKPGMTRWKVVPS